MRRPRGPPGLDVEDGTPVLRVLSFNYKSKADAFGDSGRPGVFRQIPEAGPLAASTPRRTRMRPLGDDLDLARRTSTLPNREPRRHMSSVAAIATRESLPNGVRVRVITRSASDRRTPRDAQRLHKTILDLREEKAPVALSDGETLYSTPVTPVCEVVEVREEISVQSPDDVGGERIEGGVVDVGLGVNVVCLRAHSPDRNSVNPSDQGTEADGSSLCAGASAAGEARWPDLRTPMGSTTQLISSSSRSSSRCGGKTSFAWMPAADSTITVLSLAASFGNILRLPRIVYFNGGGAFLVVYAVTAVLLGIPLAFLEIALGQFCELGALSVWRAVPLFKGVGYVKVTLSAILAIYYPVLMSLSLFYAIWTAKEPLPFPECDSEESYGRTATAGEVCLQKTFLKSPLEDPMWYSVTIAFIFLLWSITMFCVFRSSRHSRRITSLLVLPLIVGLLALLAAAGVRTAMTTTDGLGILANLDWNILFNAETWYFSVVQVFFSTHLGLGNLTTCAGRIFSKSNAFWTALWLIVINVAAGCLWVAVWFALVGGSLSPIPSVEATTSPEVLVLTALYDAAAKSTLPAAVATIAFIFIVISGFTSLVPLLDTVLVAVTGESRRRWEWWRAAAIICVFGFVLGCLSLLPERLSLVHVLDHYVVGRLALACTVTELVALCWVYGCSSLRSDLHFVLGSPISSCWTVLWFFAPLYLLAVEVWSVVVLPWDGLEEGRDPQWQVLLGWGMYFAGWSAIVGLAFRQVARQVDYNVCQKFLSAVKPARNWGPADPISRHCWLQWRDSAAAGRPDRTLRRRVTRDYTTFVRSGQTASAVSSNATAQTHTHALRADKGPFVIDCAPELAAHVCWRKEHDSVS